MSKKSNYAISRLEWELDEHFSITNVDDQENLPKGYKSIEVHRDEEYNLKATLYLESEYSDFFNGEPQVSPGNKVKLFQITGSDHENLHHFTLESCYIDGWKTQTDNSTGKSTASANIVFYGLRMKTDNREPARMCEWYINGPTDFVFSRVTRRKLISSCCRDRLEKGEIAVDSTCIPRKSSQSSVDFLVVKNDQIQFIVEKVPEEFGPNWSTNIGIEYKTEWGPIPDVLYRDKISEVCSFVFGRQLLNIGLTTFDKNDYVIETYARNPWGESAKSFCRRASNTPVSIHSMPPNHKTEEMLQKLLPEYIKHREDLRLKEALNYIWISNQMPTGPNIPILASALESIIKGWFSSAKSKSQGCFIDQEEFNKLLTPEITLIESKLHKEIDDNGEVKKIVNTISHSNSFGPTERYRAFFKEIKLMPTKKEYDAIKERHKFTHGDAIFDKENWPLVSQRRASLETLLNKVILTVLSYSGDFVDRSTIPWVEHQELRTFLSL